MTKAALRLQAWLEARRRFKLSHAHIQMAYELGMNPKKFGSLANEKQEPWKAPLADFIATLSASSAQNQIRSAHSNN